MIAATTRQNTKQAMSPFLEPPTGEARDQSRPGATEAPEAVATLRPAPRTAELVEREDTGQFYLRTFTNGRYFWQPIAGPAAAIPDTGVWLSGGEYYRAYWFNHGAYRRRAGLYYPVVRSGSATHAA